MDKLRDALMWLVLAGSSLHCAGPPSVGLHTGPNTPQNYCELASQSENHCLDVSFSASPGDYSDCDGLWECESLCAIENESAFCDHLLDAPEQTEPNAYVVCKEGCAAD